MRAGLKPLGYDATFFDNYLAMYRNIILRLYYCTATKRDATRFSETSVNGYQKIRREAIVISALQTAIAISAPQTAIAISGPQTAIAISAPQTAIAISAP
jgi:hypothetical protein